MSKYGENDKQGKYWNEAPGQSWVINDSAMNERLQAISDILFEGLDATGCNNGLDIGCGAGSTTRRLAAIMGNQARVTGLDISEKLLALARSHPESVGKDFLQADAQSYKFEPERFDLAISRFGVMFFENPFKALQNIKSAVQKGREIRFVCWAPISANDFFLSPLNTVVDITGVSFAEPGKEPGPLAFSDRTYLSSILKNAEFSSINIDIIKTSISTKDCAEKNASLLMEIGIGSRAIKEAAPTDEVLNEIREAFVADGNKRLQNGLISYDATIYRVSAVA
jgi:ubiquinone/menaquinone biosynthesis C-methylase UbiE